MADGASEPIKPAVRRPLDSREVDHVEALVTVVEPESVDAFLDRCVIGSTWSAHIRTAEVRALVLSRTPLGTFDERVCTCLRLRLDRPVPVEPGLRFQILDADSGLTATGVVRPLDALNRRRIGRVARGVSKNVFSFSVAVAWGLNR